MEPVGFGVYCRNPYVWIGKGDRQNFGPVCRRGRSCPAWTDGSCKGGFEAVSEDRQIQMDAKKKSEEVANGGEKEKQVTTPFLGSWIVCDRAV